MKRTPFFLLYLMVLWGLSPANTIAERLIFHDQDVQQFVRHEYYHPVNHSTLSGDASEVNTTLSMKRGEQNLTAKLQAANPEGNDFDAQGILSLNDHTLIYSYTHTSKGNGFITVRGEKEPLEIRCCDWHDNGMFYRDGWAQISLEDFNGDTYPDIITEYTECENDTQEGVTMREVYLYHPDGRFFKLLFKKRKSEESVHPAANFLT